MNTSWMLIRNPVTQNLVTHKPTRIHSISSPARSIFESVSHHQQLQIGLTTTESIQWNRIGPNMKVWEEESDNITNKAQIVKFSIIFLCFLRSKTEVTRYTPSLFRSALFHIRTCWCFVYEEFLLMKLFVDLGFLRSNFKKISPDSCLKRKRMCENVFCFE